jgi:hypothetical protein
MLLILVGVLSILLLALWRQSGPIRALLISWLICLTPTALGVIEYDYLQYAGTLYLWVIAASIGAFLVGAGAVRAARAQEATIDAIVDFTADYAKWKRVGSFCLAIAVVSIITTILNILTSGFDLSDLASVRAQAIDMAEANIWARIAAVTAWASFLCLGLGIYFRDQLGRVQALVYMGAGSGIFVNMLSLAGRNSVLQLIIFCLAVESIRKSRAKNSNAALRGGISSRWAMAGAGFAYLLFITLNRPGNLDAQDRSTVLFRLFSASFSQGLSDVLDHVPALKGPIVEFLLYVTHTAPLFSIQMQIDFGGHFYGIFSFPFVARQLQPFHGYSVADALELKRFYVQSAGVIGFGWTTALSSYIMDFGYIGCYIMMFVQGLASQYLYYRVKSGGGIGFVLMYVLMIINAVFTPFLPLFSDTTLFLLMVVLLAIAYSMRNKRSGQAQNATS